MGACFRGWRRKIGCITLLMAFGFMVGWVRSQTIGDGIHFNSADKSWTYFLLASADSSITIIVERCPSEMVYPEWISSELNAPEVIDSEKFEDSFKWHWRFCGFGCGVEEGNQNSKWTRTVIPYWSIVIPMTLLSAFLLLSKPRKSTQTKIVGPISAEGT